MTYIHNKRGATWRAGFTLPEVVSTYDTITADWVCKREGGSLDVRPVPDTNRVELSATAAATALWPLDVLSCSIRYTVGDEVVETQDFEIFVKREVAND